MSSAAAHALFLTLLHGRGAFRLLLKLATFAGAIALLAVSVLAGHGPGAPAHTGRFALQLLIVVLIIGAWALRWKYDTLLRRLCPANTTSYLSV